MEKINIAELLKDCPKGMELDCVMYNDVTLRDVDCSSYPIQVQTPEGNMNLSRYGCMSLSEHVRCIIFPKGKTTWEGFVPPCKFKDGDVIFTHTNALKCDLDNNWVSIFKEYRNNRCACYACLCLSDLELYHDKWEDELLCELCEIEESRLATEEEKERLFQAIKDNGYKWNTEAKTLEKLPKFKVGDRIKDKNNKEWFVGRVFEKHFDISSVPNAEGYYVPIAEQDEYELVPDKFEITTLKPFESRVLVRDEDCEIWRVSFWGCLLEKREEYKYDTTRGSYAQCVPYEGNEHLLGTDEDCDDYYKNWK